MTVKTLDKYIIKKFLGTYIFAILLILAIIVMFDVNEKLDNFMKAPLSATIFDYYLNFLPYMANQFSPLFTFIAVIFFTSKLADNSEIIAMMSTGMSFERMMRPYMISAAIIALLTFFLGAYVIPEGSATRLNFENIYKKKMRPNYAQNVQLQVEPGVVAWLVKMGQLMEHHIFHALPGLPGQQIAPFSPHSVEGGFHKKQIRPPAAPNLRRIGGRQAADAAFCRQADGREGIGHQGHLETAERAAARDVLFNAGMGIGQMAHRANQTAEHFPPSSTPATKCRH